MATRTVTQLDIVQADSFNPNASKSTPTATSTLEIPPVNERAGQILRTESTENRTTTSTPEATLPNDQATIVTAQLAGLTFLSSFSNGLITVGIPAMAAALDLQTNLLACPLSVFPLTNGSLLLLGGSFADVIGARTCNLTGAFFTSVFTLACGFSQTGLQLIMFRAMQGIAAAFTVPSSIAIISTSVRSGRSRNMGFASPRLAQTTGFSVGLVLGGVFVASVGWRAGFYIGGGLSLLLFVWTGLLLASSALALLSYILSVLSSDVNNIRRASNIALLIVSAMCAAAFIYWERKQEQRQRPVLMLNSLWKKHSFTSICFMVMIATAVTNSVELYSSLFFQEVQSLSALQASIRMLPNMLVGLFTNALTGLLINRIPALGAVLRSAVLCAIPPVLMATIDPAWAYWYSAFFAQSFSPFIVDVLFTVGIRIVSDVFPVKTQALAGAVFNTMAQVGSAIGLTATSILSSSITKKSHSSDQNQSVALMEGYRVAFWMMFGFMAFSCLLALGGLRKLGRIGEKRD